MAIDDCSTIHWNLYFINEDILSLIFTAADFSDKYQKQIILIALLEDVCK